MLIVQYIFMDDTEVYIMHRALSKITAVLFFGSAILPALTGSHYQLFRDGENASLK